MSNGPNWIQAGGGEGASLIKPSFRGGKRAGRFIRKVSLEKVRRGLAGVVRFG